MENPCPVADVVIERGALVSGDGEAAECATGTQLLLLLIIYCTQKEKRSIRFFLVTRTGTRFVTLCFTLRTTGASLGSGVWDGRAACAAFDVQIHDAVDRLPKTRLLLYFRFGVA